MSHVASSLNVSRDLQQTPCRCRKPQGWFSGKVRDRSVPGGSIVRDFESVKSLWGMAEPGQIKPQSCPFITMLPRQRA
ncbi:hypothetical protein RRG08_064233 [Elysia crispata]|uniref:Uncharacterized protein n=1 Tax=Elysia crispata TaxID=231223 RepID=A0AAE0YEH7_9GAST|nr:hypothetical protein RRG08_064233 [Elysia crispata]